MIWAVLDTNTLVCGFGRRGAPARVVDVALRGEFMLVTSLALLVELERALHYPKLHRVFPDPARVVELVREVAEVVDPTPHLHACRDAVDNRVLEAALAGNVDVIVTGDADLKDLDPYDTVRIVDANVFLTMLA